MLLYFNTNQLFFQYGFAIFVHVNMYKNNVCVLGVLTILSQGGYTKIPRVTKTAAQGRGFILFCVNHADESVYKGQGQDFFEET